MDAYGTDSDARHGPDGPGTTPEPEGPPEPSDRPDQPSDQDDGPDQSSDQDDGLDQLSDQDHRPDQSSDPDRHPELIVPPRPDAPDAPYAETRTGVAALSPRYQIGAALALAVVAVAVCVHLGMVFLHVAPSNTLTKAHGKAIDEWVYPEFEQNWKLFAPNPLQQNIAVQVRAEVQAKDGGVRTTGWYDLSAEDGRAIDGNLVPSHTQQNELRRAWDFFVATHDSDNRPSGVRGALSENYLRRIVALRLERDDAAGKGGVVDRVQVRSSTTNVAPPRWSAERISDKPMYRVLPWWPVTTADTDGGAE
ncbi:DUF5819 family protein [Streptomyces sp. NPDC050534]|uniref:DUF5819 family protein n=1 Tax=Streptomyces sp. NPDC050534 TaxID=3365625 RepID=UPI0037B8B25D